MKKIYQILILIFAMTSSLSAQQITTNVTNSWFGNTNPDHLTFMPQGIEGMFVNSDGTVYTNIYWEEGGGNLTKIAVNGAVSHADGMFGWGHAGGIGICANASYVFAAQEYTNEGGKLYTSNPTAYPSTGNKWYGITRRNVTDISAGTPFTGGKDCIATDIVGSFLPIFTVPEVTDRATAEIKGIHATATELFVACPYDNKIRVYNASTMALNRSFTVTNPYHIFMDGYGKLWVSIGENATIIESYNATTGVKEAQTINLPSGSFVGSFSIDANNRLLMGDVGQNEQVRIYTGLNSTPTLSSTFGTQFGIYSGVAGQMAPLKFHQVRGIGTDNSGNIYIGNTQGYTAGPGINVESYTSAGTLNWNKHCEMFVDCSASDESTNGASIYGPVERYSVDYSKPAGQEATLAAYTVNRYKYPNDSRIITEGAGT